MQKQIQDLTTEIQILKTQNKPASQLNNELVENNENEQQVTIFSPQPPSPRKIRLLQRTDNQPTSHTSKNLQGASAEDKGVTKEDITEVMKLIQNTMQTLTVFEKRFKEQKSI